MKNEKKEKDFAFFNVNFVPFQTRLTSLLSVQKIIKKCLCCKQQIHNKNIEF